MFGQEYSCIFVIFSRVILLSIVIYSKTGSCICLRSHWCTSYASLKRLIQRLRDMADLQIPETSPGRLIKGITSEASLRSRRFSQKRLWVATETVTLGLQIKGLDDYLFIYLRVFECFVKRILKVGQSLV